MSSGHEHPRPPGYEVKEVVGGQAADPASGRPPAARGRPSPPGPAVRAALLVGGLTAAIIAFGLIGSRPAATDQASSSPAPRGVTRSPGPEADVVVPTPPEPIPLLRRSGALLADPVVLVSGRWMSLATGRAVSGAPDDCARSRVLVLGSGRIVCVTADIIRSPGSRIALFDLVVRTVGAVRADPAGSPPAGPPVSGGEPQALATLLGRRDVVIGDPVAIAVVPGPGPDDLVLAWATVDNRQYEVGLEAFHLADAGTQAERVGDWVLGRAPSVGRDAVDTLGDLAVAVDPAGGGRAMVGWTEAGRGVTGPVRRLAVVPLDGSGPPTVLPAASTRNLAPEAADGPLRTGTPCGGAFGEGFAGEGSAYVVCPGETAEIRLLDTRSTATGGSTGSVLAVVPLEPGGSTTGSAWLAGNGVAVDAARAVLYRWSPAAGTIWRVELGSAAPEPGGKGGAGRARALPLPPGGERRQANPDVAAAPGFGARPTLALDSARGRLYALDAPAPGSDRAVVHVVDLDRWRHVASFPLEDPATRAISLSPDGALLYASTEPRQAGSLPVAVGVAVVDAITGSEIAYAGRLRVSAGGPLQPVVAR